MGRKRNGTLIVAAKERPSVLPFMLEISSKVPPPSSSSRPKAKARLYIARLPASQPASQPATPAARGCLLIQRPIQPCSFPFLLQRQAVQFGGGCPPQHNSLYQHVNQIWFSFNDILLVLCPNFVHIPMLLYSTPPPRAPHGCSEMDPFGRHV